VEGVAVGIVEELVVGTTETTVAVEVVVGRVEEREGIEAVDA
jgi:hypothetical protein